MTLIVEDGSVVPAANSYVTSAEADAFFAAQFLTLWTDTASDEAKEAALIKATFYLTQKYRLMWKGSRVDGGQALDWPRRGVDVPDFFDPFFNNVNVPFTFQNTLFVGEDTIPDEVKFAQMMLAVVTLDASGESTIPLQTSFGRKTKKEKVGSLEVEYMTAEEGGNTSQTNTYWDAEQIVSPFLRPEQPHTGQVVRS